MTDEVKKENGWSKFCKFLGGFFRDDKGDPSMMRVVTLINALSAVFFGFLMFKHTSGGNIVNPYEFWLTCYFALLAVLGKGAQKVVELYISKKIG